MARNRPPFRVERPLSMAVQELHMRDRWPSFTRVGNAGVSVWRGNLQPSEVSGEYGISVEYRLGVPPNVRVLRPKLLKTPPHTYPGAKLCLYSPDDWRWDEHSILACSIIPWTAAWLLFYELWLDTGKWLAPEAPHNENKRVA